MKMLKKTLAMLLALIMVLSLAACGASEEKPAETAPAAQAGEAAAPEAETPAEPVKITIYYPDSSTAPFQKDWLALQEVAKLANAEVTIEAIPEADYGTPVNLALDTQENCPDVIMFQEIYGAKASLCMNGGVVSISDYADWTPNFNAMAEKMGLTDQVNNLKLADGKRYIMPSLHESLEYSGGLILRTDFLESHGFETPKTFDDLYEILKAYKAENPDSYPMVHYLFPYITHRMIMPAWGCPVGYWVPPYLGSIAWDYENENYYVTATSDVYREYLQFMNKLADEGLLDPEASADDVWSQKMTSGAAICTYAYYDQIAGLEAASDIEGYDLDLYLPLEGPAGALGENRGQAYRGLLFPAPTAEREDFEQVVRAIDTMFYSEEAAKIWSIGVEGVTYNVVDGKVEFVDAVKNAPEGINKYLQINYGCGTSGFQSVWPDEYTLLKFDEEYAEIYAAASAMNANQPYAPEPWFDDLAAEDAGMIANGAMFDLVETYREQFINGDVDVDDDAVWADYVAQLEASGLQEYLDLYNEYRNQG
ncbi:MAG: extracellular solute-binding protein [Oscillospiraceae bacterium]|nr:extracellular solute-binding protein [Oscillospiraceae bacterium]